MNTKLTNDQLDYLYEFVSKNVEFYDVQTELVDHMANGIEEQWEHNPMLDFDSAFKNEFKKFGISGFESIVEERRKALHKKYLFFVLNKLKHYFKLPRILGTLLAIVLVQLLLQWLSPNLGFKVVWYCLIVCYAAVSVIYILNYRKKAKNQKVMLMERIMFRDFALSYMSILAYFTMNVTLHLSKFKLGYTSTWFIAVGLVVAMLLGYIVFIKLPKDSEKLLQQWYPGYKDFKKV